MCFVLVGSFFFFKQKTEYGLRISDWSSDGCSSDLLVDAVRDCELRRNDDVALILAIDGIDEDERLAVTRFGDDLGDGRDRGHRIMPGFRYSRQGGRKSSCRERVCQYV